MKNHQKIHFWNIALFTRFNLGMRSVLEWIHFMKHPTPWYFTASHFNALWIHSFLIIKRTQQVKVPRKVWLCVLRQYFEAGLPRFRHQEEVSTNIIKSVLLSWLGTRHTTYASTCTVTWYTKLNYTLCHTKSWIYTPTLLIRRSCKCIEHHWWAAGCGSTIQLWQNFASYCI